MGEVGFRAVSPISVPLITGNVVWKEVESSASGWGLSMGENCNQPQNIPVSAPSSPCVRGLRVFGKVFLELEEGRTSCCSSKATLGVPAPGSAPC